MSMVVVALGTVTIVLMVLLFGLSVIDQLPKTDTGALKYGLLALYVVYIGFEYVGVPF